MIQNATNRILQRRRRSTPTGDCEQVRGLLSPFMDGQTSPPLANFVERHLASCDACRAELASLQHAVGLLRQVPVAAPRRSFALAAPRPAPRRPAFAGLRLAAAVAVIALVAVFSGDLLHKFEVTYETEAPQEEQAPAPGGPAQKRAADSLGADDRPLYSMSAPEVNTSMAAAQQQSPGTLDATQSVITMKKDAAWLRPLEYSLLGMAVVLGIFTFAALRHERRLGL